MRALVTGANGLIGSNLVRALLTQGHCVRAFVRSTSNLQSLQDVDAELVFGDILEIESLIKAAQGCDVLFHVAAIFSYSRHRPDELTTVARTGTINAIEAAKEAGIKRIVLTSSSVVFGSQAEPTPMDESARRVEQDVSPYTASKKIQEQVAFERAAALGIDIVGVYPTICVGPNDTGLSESNAIIVNYLRDPFKATWPGGCNIVSAHDIAKGHILVAEKGQSGGRYLLGSQNLRWSEIHGIISDMCGIEGPLMTANHTSCYLAAAMHEFIGIFNTKRPLASRAQAKMVGRYYWYRHDRATALGYDPLTARQAMAKAISWLAKSDHISGSIRSAMTLSQEVYDQRQ